MANRVIIAVILIAATLSPYVNATFTNWMLSSLNQHFSQPRHHVTNPQYKQQAMVFILEEFQRMGLETHQHFFNTAVTNVTGVNVIGVLKGQNFNTSQDKVVAIGAHYDTMRHTPGVNDNGAGVVVMLKAAWELSCHPSRPYTLLFVAFDFEEWEFPDNTLVACHKIGCGSRSLVSEWIPSYFHSSIGWQGIFVMDTIMDFTERQSSQTLPPGLSLVFPAQVQSINSDGRQGDFLMIAGRQADLNLISSFNKSWNSLDEPDFEIETFTLPFMSPAFRDFLRSDHASFWEAGYKALFLSDTANFRSYMVQCYHHPCDSISKVTPSMLLFATKTCQTLINTMNTLSPVIGDDLPVSGCQG